MTAPLILVMPGASLMEFTPTTTGVQVRCPGCGEAQTFDTASGNAAFVHADDCAIHRKIQAAITRYERTVVRRG